ncbi:glycosyltransferase family 2 protein [Vibrio cholerae]
MTVSLVITTYNWESALTAVLQSAETQTHLPDEIIIADDGSGPATQRVVEHFQSQTAIPVLHSWQEDVGFRLSMSRNRAIAQAKCDYIVMIDGDIVMPPRFIEDHIRAAKKGWFIQGGRVQVGPKSSEALLEEPKKIHYFSQDIRNRKNTISNSILANCFSYKRNNDAATRGCNMSFWKKDVIAVNGFNEAFEGWGREDSEFVHRMLNKGLNRLYLKFAGAGLHLYHDENSRALLPENEKIFQMTVDNRLQWCEQGINQYLSPTTHDD